MEKERINWIDAWKGFAIILVVLGHSNVPFAVNKYILSFHMPLFFIVSGMLYNKKKYDLYSFKDFVVKKFKELIIPYLWFSSFTIIISFVLRLVVVKERVNLLYPIISVLTCINIQNQDMIEMVLWFLPCVFVVEVIFYSMIKNRLVYKHLNIILVVFFVFGFVESNLLDHVIPFTIDIAITAIVYYGIGFLGKNYIAKSANIIKSNVKISIILIIVTFMLSLICVKFNSIVYMYTNEYGNYLLAFIGSIAGSITIMTLAVHFNKIKLVNFLGQNTLLIFVIHMKIIFVTRKIFGKIVTKMHGGFPIELVASIADACLVIAILIPIIKVINNYLPFLIGKSKSKVKTNKVMSQ